MDEYKRCPDCAEMVRAQARRCRYCGYRFAGSLLPSLAQLVRRPPPPARLEDVLSGWGTDLAAGETVAFFGFCKLEHDDGYLLLTGARVIFYVSRGSRAVIEWPLADLRGVEIARHRGVRELRLAGVQRTVTIRRFVTRQALEEAAAHLRRALSQPTS